MNLPPEEREAEEAAAVAADGAPSSPREPDEAPAAKASPRRSLASATAAAVAGGATSRKSYPQFLERIRHPSAQAVLLEVRDFLREFPSDSTRLQAARRVHSFLAGATERLVAVEAFADYSAAEAEEVVSEGLEKFILIKLYKLLFRQSPADVREDERVESCLRAAPLVMPVELPEESQELLEAAVAELQKVDQYRAPRDKAKCLLNAHRICEGIVVEDAFRRGGRREDEGADGEDSFLHRVLVVLIVKAVPTNFASNLEFTASFRQPSRKGVQEQRCLRDLSTALATATGGGSAASMAAAAGGFSRGVSREALPPWLEEAGVSLGFEDRAAGGLLLGEVDDLLAEYHRMIGVLRELAGPPQVVAVAQ